MSCPTRTAFALLLALGPLSACAPLHPDGGEPWTGDTGAGDPSAPGTGPSIDLVDRPERAPAECAASTPDGPVTTPEAPVPSWDCDWSLSADLPDGITQDQVDRVFALGTHTQRLDWQDGTSADITFEVTQISATDVWAPAPGDACESVMLADMTLVVSSSDGRVDTTVATTVYMTEAWVVWNMAELEVELAPMPDCTHGLWFRGHLHDTGVRGALFGLDAAAALEGQVAQVH